MVIAHNRFLHRRWLRITAIALMALAGCTEEPASGPDTANQPDESTSDGQPPGDGQAQDTQGGDTASSDTTAVETIAGDGEGSDTTGEDASTDVATPDADTASPADTGDASKDTTTGPSDGFNGLLVKILGPSGRDWIQNTGSKIQLAGVAYGGAESMNWSTADGKSGTITPTLNWKSSIIDLVEGDNHITVTAKKGDKVVSDTIHVTFNPVFQFEGPPDMTPNVLFVNENAKIVVHFAAAAAVAGPDGSSVVDAGSLQLVEVDENGKDLAGGTTTKLMDSGSGNNCDDVAKDAVFSNCLNLQPSQPKTKYFRVKADVDIGVKKFKAMSPVAVVDVVARFDKGTCNTIVSLQKKVKADYLAAVAGGKSAKDAQAEAIAALKADAGVAEAGAAEAGGFGVWIRYKSGQLGALSLAPAGMRAGAGAFEPGAALNTHSVGARRALALAPFKAEFTAAGGDEADQAGQALKAKQCPPFAVDSAEGSGAYLRWYREMSNYGLVAITGHGEALFGGMDLQTYKDLGWKHQGAQEVLWSGEQVNCQALSSSNATCNQQGGGCPAGETCVKTSLSGGVCVDNTQADIMRGRVVIGDETYALTPSFLRHHLVNQFPGSIVYLGACRTMFNGSLAVQLWGNGAAAIIGFSDYVTAKFAAEQGKALMDGLIGKTLSAIQSIPTTGVDAQYGGRLKIVGIGEANLDNAKLINNSWDLGNLTGWKPAGDGRTVSRLGVTIPVAGKYMGIISTGLGFTAQNGSLTQPFCVDNAQKELCFFWKFYSEEFVEYCGSSFMDTFTATLKSDIQNTTMVNVYIDSLCPYDCGGKTPCEPGSPSCKCGKDWKTLSPADVNFDQGGVWMTPWQKSCTDVSALANQDKKVDLTFFATDKGDSIFDTVILLDEVTVK